MEELLNLALNLMGTFAFGLSGGILAVRKQMDLFGVLVLAVAAGLGGGMPGSCCIVRYAHGCWRWGVAGRFGRRGSADLSK